MQEATFCDWLINRGVQFHPDTVIVDIQSLSESYNVGLHNSSLDPIGSMGLPPYEYMFFEWEVFPGGNTSRYGVYLQHRKESFYSNFRGEEKFHHWGATVFCISFISFMIPGKRYIHISDDVFYYEINEQGICDGYPAVPVYDGMGKDIIFCQYGGHNIFQSEFYGQNAGIEFDSQYRYYVHNAIYGIDLFYKEREIELVDYSRQKRRRIERKTGKAPSPYFRILDASDKPQKRYAGSSGVSTGRKLEKAHIVRGHFRHTQDHPIAQFNGTFWIASHVKGKGENAPPPRYKIVLRDK